MRAIMTFAVLAAVLLPTAAWAQDCGKLQLLNTVQMIPTTDGNQEFVPVQFEDGKKTKFLLLDTAGWRSTLTPDVVKDLQLSTFEPGFGMMGGPGLTSDKLTKVDSFRVGRMKGEAMNFMVAPWSIGQGGFATDLLGLYDADIDFGTDKLNYFSQNHCPGAVKYWTAPAVAVLPMTLDNVHHIWVQIELDGKPIKALIDTGATATVMPSGFASTLFDLTPGDQDTPLVGSMYNGLPRNVFGHIFKQMTFGGVAVNNAKIYLFQTQKSPVGAATIGMDVLRKLHLYFAFKENKIYISEASQPAPADIAQFTPEYLAYLASEYNPYLESHPNDANTLFNRCYWRAIAKTDLSAAQDDCDHAFKLKPDDGEDGQHIRAVLLYQQNKKQEALEVLSAGSPNTDALFLRGIIKGQLGDQSGKDVDMAAAKKAKTDVDANFQRLGLLPLDTASAAPAQAAAK